MNYIIKRKKVFSPKVTSVKNESSLLLIPKQTKRTSFTEISQDKASTIIYNNIPKYTSFEHITL